MDPATLDIAEDWEHVDDDGFSIISLASDDDSLEPPGGQPAVCAVSCADNPVDSSHQPQSKSLTPALSSKSPQQSQAKSPTSDLSSQSPLTNKEPNNTQTIERCDTNEAKEPKVVRPNTPPVQQVPQPPNDYVVDDDVLYKQIGSSAQLLGRIRTGLYSRNDPHGIHIHLKTNCGNLKYQLDQLQDILRGSRAQLPLSALTSWANTLKSELLTIQSMLDDPNAAEYTYPYKSPVLCAADESCKRIEHLHNQLNEMIRAGYSDLRKTHSSLIAAHARHGWSRTGPKLYETPLNRTASGSKDDYSSRRQEIYKLRDQIVACLGEIHSYQHHGICDSDQRKKLAAWTLSYNISKDSIDQMLLNSGPDLYTISDGVLNIRYRQLNLDTINSLIIQLKEVTDVLFSERAKAQTLYRTRGSLGYENLIIDTSSLDTLSKIDETLHSIFLVPTCNKD